MKIRYLILCLLLLAGLTGCGESGAVSSVAEAPEVTAEETASPETLPAEPTEQAEASVEEPAEEVSSAGEPALTSEEIQAAVDVGIEEVVAITEVFGEGQKLSAAAVKYALPIAPDSVSPEDFSVEGQTIDAAYVSDRALPVNESTEGCYVILKFHVESTASPESSMGGGRGGFTGMEGPATQGNPGGFGGMENAAGQGNPGGFGGMENAPDDAGGLGGESSAVTVTQTGAIALVEGTEIPAGEDPVPSSSRVDAVVEDFQQLEYTDPETGYTIPYNLYLPEGYDESETYPLIMFIADAGANQEEVTTALTQGNGAVIWATPEEQAKHPCIVLAPQYTTTLVNELGLMTEDDHQWTEGLTLVDHLLHQVIEDYSVDENRIYSTGQSQGCMATIALSDKYPDLFAAQFLVAGQWDTEEMSVMKDDKLWIVVCQGDTKAYPGMNEATANWKSLGAQVAEGEMWDSTLPAEELEQLVEETLSQGCDIQYTVLQGGNHNYTWQVAYNIEGIRDWLFAQSK